MNLGALLILVELLRDIGAVSPRTGKEGQTYEIKPNCGPGLYASKVSGSWTCLKIPKGR